MFSIRKSLLALAAIASLGLATLVTSTQSADARGFGGGFSRGGGGGHIGMRVSGPRMGGMRHIGVRPIGINRHIHLRRHVHIHRPHWCHRHPWRCNVRVHWPRPVIYGAPVVAAAAYAAPVAAAPRCTCLTKEYTQEGTVIFRDVCTKEIASAPTGTTVLPLPPATTTMPQQSELQQQDQPQVR